MLCDARAAETGNEISSRNLTSERVDNSTHHPRWNDLLFFPASGGSNASPQERGELSFRKEVIFSRPCDYRNAEKTRKIFLQIANYLSEKDFLILSVVPTIA